MNQTNFIAAYVDAHFFFFLGGRGEEVLIHKETYRVTKLHVN
jgi:hypothetical protein